MENATTQDLITVDVFSDVVCPWCFVGKRRLERAVKALPPGASVLVRWLPFQLNPQMPSGGMDRREYRIAKFGSWRKSQELDARVAEVGATEGIVFAHDRMERTPNSLDAHRLIALAGQEGIQDAVVESIFRAYFTEGRDISRRDILLDVAGEAGLDRVRAERFLATGGDIQDELAEALKYEVSAVPFFVINGKVGLSGARSVAEFLAAFEYAADTEPYIEGETCPVDADGKRAC